MRRRWARTGIVATAVVAACGFEHGALQDGGMVGDGPADGPPDAAKCMALTDECLGDTWRHCDGPGATAVDTQCGWGCQDAISSAGPTHCVVVNPSGSGGNIASGASPSDTLPNTDLHDVSLGANVQIDSDLGKMGVPPNPNLRGSGGTGIINGIDFQRRGPVSVFRFKSLTIDGPVTLIGSHSVVLVADGNITINGLLDARGLCTTTIAGPGGGAGGAKQGGDGGDPGGGGGGTAANIGGGGGGNGGAGGDGGNGTNAANTGGPAGGAVITDPAVLVLVGGGGGGGGDGGGGAGSGGGGGGAVQLISNGVITINTAGGINAGGCGAQNGSAGNDAGGGGGAGGTILIEVPKMILAGALAVNGGGGGGGAAGNLARAANGSLDLVAAPGGNGGADGGSGASGNSPVAEKGHNNGGKGGGGGGGLGRIRLNTRGNTGLDIKATAVLSPNVDDPTTTTTQGSAATVP